MVKMYHKWRCIGFFGYKSSLCITNFQIQHGFAEVFYWIWLLAGFFKVAEMQVLLDTKAKLAQQPTLGQDRTSPFRITIDRICFFYIREKSMLYPGIEPSTFEVAVGYVNYCTI
jgi:hypothetical protein